MSNSEEPDVFVDLVVVGAAAGMGAWLTEHVLSRGIFGKVELVDLNPEAIHLKRAIQLFPGSEVSATPSAFEAFSSNMSAGRRQSKAILIAVPGAVELESVLSQIPVSPPSGALSLAIVCDDFIDTEVAVRKLGLRGVLLHPLFDSTANGIDGHSIFASIIERREAPSFDWLQFLESVGATVHIGAPFAHDSTMDYVQRATQLSLLTFLEVLGKSKLDLQTDMWAARTPQFELMMGLSARLISPSQQGVVSRLQDSVRSRTVMSELIEAQLEVRRSMVSVDAAPFSEYIASIRDRISGTFFGTLENVGSQAASAAESIRRSLALKAARGDLVGVRNRHGRPSFHVGYIRGVGSGYLRMDDVFVSGGERGGVLWVGVGIENGRKVGVSGKVKSVTLNLGHIELLSDVELESELNARLAYIRRDIRFLVPESISGRGVLSAVSTMRDVVSPTLCSEVVRTGQRSVVISVRIRSDMDANRIVENLRVSVDSVYRWPTGISRPWKGSAVGVHYLGPPGTFSQAAARGCAETAQLLGSRLIPEDSFANVLEAVKMGEIGVLPIVSSTSGLVSLAADALLQARDILVGGMVDVPVRFDAYCRVGLREPDIRGAALYSHPQAIAQCSAFITTWKLHPIPCQSTAEALERAREDMSPSIAISAAGIPDLPESLRVFEREIDDIAGAITRFLIVGRPDSFGKISNQYAPTSRSLWVGNLIDGRMDLKPDEYTEFLRDDFGNFLLIGGAEGGLNLGPDVSRQFLGVVPWSPRTPIVRASR